MDPCAATIYLFFMISILSAPQVTLLNTFVIKDPSENYTDRQERYNFTLND